MCSLLIDLRSKYSITKILESKSRAQPHLFRISRYNLAPKASTTQKLENTPGTSVVSKRVKNKYDRVRGIENEKRA